MIPVDYWAVLNLYKHLGSENVSAAQVSLYRVRSFSTSLIIVKYFSHITYSSSRHLKSSEPFLYSLNYRVLYSFKWTALNILAFELCLIHIVASAVWLPSGQLFYFKFYPLSSIHVQLTSLPPPILPQCRSDNAMVWGLRLYQVSAKSFTTFSFHIWQSVNFLLQFSWRIWFFHWTDRIYWWLVCVLFHPTVQRGALSWI